MSMIYKVAAGALGALTTIVAQKVVSAGWRSVTGHEPPNPDDPNVSTLSAISWTIASGVGLAVAQLLVTRFAARQFGEQSDAAERPSRADRTIVASA